MQNAWAYSNLKSVIAVSYINIQFVSHLRYNHYNL